VKYRLAHAKGSPYTVEGDALADVQRALRTVRARAGEWSVDPQRVGIIGFSAGGELVALAATRYDLGAPGAADPIDRVSDRPAFQALLYPSIPRNLKLSKETPRAFLLCGADDQPGISQGLAQLYLDLRHAGAAAELHIYAGVGHGFGLRPSNEGPVTAWPQQFLDWIGAP
jgi:acetyl esterase/lipase